MKVLRITTHALALVFVALLALSCRTRAESVSPASLTKVESPSIKQLIEGAMEQTEYTRYYDPAYVKIPYPGGDVARERGVCTDVVIRAFRKVGIDLQKDVHEDMKQNFSVYPQRWGLKKPDTNIDHRRVPNLMTYFKRKGKSLAVTDNPEDYKPGDVVAWDLGGGVLHTGVVTNALAEDGKRYRIVHNICCGASLEDVLQSWKIIGHYRYFNQ